MKCSSGGRRRGFAYRDSIHCACYCACLDAERVRIGLLAVRTPSAQPRLFTAFLLNRYLVKPACKPGALPAEVRPRQGQETTGESALRQPRQRAGESAL
jgi:hypothetical protein